ncbi:signal transduction histidine kinase [Kineosphaera limosa]|uniref:Two-component histidine kinase DevS n=1 Tax=Kineosphaera limosa NBRC 100340 TaxID=1184609 RepID=K6X8C7_9MICO|nr:GAF domain-containing sensor histidine kinase [Kineosphaera limosa]NYE03028.1 signal transduction histidine kinase [Kineosphaera limosa]GAB95079.1 two-component histidine kinase DevS [Kineosphaera limosa NBRC 100340]
MSAPLEPDHSQLGVGLDIEDLLDEIRRRAAGATQAQERLGQLLSAVVAISSDLELPAVLAKVLHSACELLGARYGALGVLDATGRQLADFITHGLTAEQRERIGDLPHGGGVLGLLIRDPQTMRLDDIRDHPESVGFPPHHPPMRTFIGASVRVRDTVFGNLYLCDRNDGQPFDEADGTVLEGLAAAAGIAIENAQLFDRARGRQQWAEVMAELTQTLLEGRNEAAALGRMVKHARELGGAHLGLLAVRDETGRLVVRAQTGAEHGREVLGARLMSPRWTILLKERVPLLLMTMPGDRHVGELAAELARLGGAQEFGACAIVPITVGEVEVGLIALAWTTDGRGEATQTMDLLTPFAEQMGLAIEAARAQRQRSRAQLLEDRDRIARDMHDHVIQRLFAAGLSLQAAGRHVEPVVRERLEGVVDELDTAVKTLREAIFELHQHLPEGGLGPEIESLVEQFAEHAGYVPDLAFEGMLSEVPPHLEHDVVAVVREGLSNVARHSRASDAQVRVSTSDGLVVTIQDNGVGLGEPVRRSGLGNLDGRAAAHGGSFALVAREPTGTLLRWRVPLP